MNNTISCLGLKIVDKTLLLPVLTIVDITIVQQLKALSESPVWLEGLISWRTLQIPLISLEKMEDNHSYEKTLITPNSLVAIVNRVSKREGSESTKAYYPFLGILLQAVPKKYSVQQLLITAVDDTPGEKGTQQNIFTKVKMVDDFYYIVDLEKIWTLVDGLEK